MSWLAIKLACFLLKLPLSLRERTRLTGAILDGLDAAPLRNLIEVRSDGVLLIEGKPIDYEKAAQLRESARAMLNNQAHVLVREQVASIAGRRGVAEGDTPEKLYFYRAALWWGGQEEEFYSILAGLHQE